MSKRDEKRQQILDYVTEKVTKEGYVPSVREICTAVGLSSPATVHYHLNQLCDEGLISKEPNKKRLIRIPNSVAPGNNARVPLVGRVTAGLPILAVEEFEEYVTCPGELIRGREAFALRVRGESMKNAGILDGDLVIVERTPYAENGEIVVALLDEEATVKRFFREDGHFRLQPENDSFAPILCNEVKILGKVIGLQRYNIR